MRFQTTRFLGRILLVPVALSGICFGLLLGIPMTRAAGVPLTHVMDAHAGHIYAASVEADSPTATDAGCCAEVRMEHGTDATVPDHKTHETPAEALVAAILSPVTISSHLTAPPISGIPPEPPPYLRPSFLAKTLLKRE